MRSFINRVLLGISPDEALFSRRGFKPVERAKQRRFEHIGQTFIAGYQTALRDQTAENLTEDLNQFEDERRGFAYEGAAMALAITDSLWRQRRFHQLLMGGGHRHRYMMHVGFGWAMARLPWLKRNPMRTLSAHDPLLNPLIIDGYGFHEGYFHWQSVITRYEVPKWLDARLVRLFDQGLGRSLWFFNGADVLRTQQCIDRFPAHRHGDLWSGVGLAATYAGGASAAELVQLQDISGHYARYVGQGSAFAAQARSVAGNVTPHTEVAVRALCGQSIADAGRLTETALDAVKDADPASRYEAWRAEIRQYLSTSVMQ